MHETVCGPEGAAIAGDTVVIGAVSDDDNGDGSGSAYIFDLAQ